MAKLNIPTKTDGVSNLNAEEVNNIVKSVNNLDEELQKLKDNEYNLDGGGV